MPGSRPHGRRQATSLKGELLGGPAGSAFFFARLRPVQAETTNNFPDSDRTLESVAEPVCRAHSVELVDIRHLRAPGGAVVRVMIDRFDPATGRSSVTLEDCTAVSRDLSAALDVHEDLVSGSYRLEVSSPGIERPLVKLSDFDRFADREIKVQVHAPKDGRRKFQGTLHGVVGQTIQLEQDGVMVAIQFEEITKAHLVHRFAPGSR